MRVKLHIEKNRRFKKIVVVGAGAAAISCARLYKILGAREIYMLDSKGVIHNGRSDLNDYKREFCALDI